MSDYSDLRSLEQRPLIGPGGYAGIIPPFAGGYRFAQTIPDERFLDLLCDISRTGATVAEHPLWGGVHPSYHDSPTERGSWHVGGGAADITGGARLIDEHVLAVCAAHGALGCVKWRGPSHFDHLHVQAGSEGNFLGPVQYARRGGSTCQGAILTRAPRVARGHSGPRVVAVQAITGAAQDGSYGPATEARVRAWQSAHGLAADGVCGPATLRAMIVADPVLRPGATGPRVVLWQTLLDTDQDGSFGPRTEGLTRCVQARAGLAPDALVGSASGGLIR